MIVTREEFNKMKRSAGGDLWNQSKLCAIAFNKFPDALCIEYNLTTGLYTTIEYIVESGEKKTGNIYDNDHQYLK